jgi:hypothetical protein
MLEERSEVGVEAIDYLPIKVNEKILLHLGGGIYSSLAAAMKELVNNAFDADAKQVIISTGYPDFNEMRIFDTGHGMSLERFKMALVSIGNSMKDTIDESRITKQYKRPIIGRLGIGLMALSQLCDKAIIESQQKGANSKFSALIDFTPWRRNGLESGLSVLSSQYGGTEALRRQLEQKGLSPERREVLRLHLKLALSADKVRQKKGIELMEEHLGYCMFMDEVPALPDRQGTLIILLGIREEIKRFLRNEARPIEPPHGLDWETYQSQINKWSWRELVMRMRAETDGLTIQALPAYHQFLYELALLSPVPYFDDGPISIRPEILAEKKSEIKSFKFSLRVDKHRLHKPILLPSGMLAQQACHIGGLGAGSDFGLDEIKEGVDVIISTLNFDEDVDGSRLKYQGYLYWQKNQNKPSAIHGIQLYIRHVGIGLYDQTLLNFTQINSTIKPKHLSGEIYVEFGLEQALNVNRQSLRESDPHYLVLQQTIFQELASISEQSMRADEWHRTAQLEEYLTTLQEVLSVTTNGKRDLNVNGDDATSPLVMDELILNLDSNRWAGGGAERLLGQKILLTMKAAYATGASAEDTLELVEGVLLK